MGFCDDLAADVRRQLKGLTFSQTLDTYLVELRTGPQEDDGYTDKRHYYMIEALRERMDLMVGGPEALE